MHIPADVAALADRVGPFATVHLDVTRATENAAKEIELRAREAAERLAAAGADEATVAAVVDALGSHREIAGRRGQFVVAAGGSVLLDRATARPPVREIAHWGPLPHLLPLFAQTAPPVPHVVVVTDRTGADVYVVDADAAMSGGSGDAESVTGSAPHPIHRTGRNTWDERHFQNRVENDWSTNAKDVTDDVVKRANDVRAQVVVVAGDERARALVVTDLTAALPQGIDVADVEVGGRAAGSSREALDEAVHDVLLRAVWRERRAVLEQLRQGLGREDYGVAGLPGVVEALRRAQVEKVVLSDDPSSTLKAWIGPDPLQLALSADELRELGVAEPVEDRFDAALVRAVAASDAQLLVTPDAHDYVPDGIGAVLRYTDASTVAGDTSTGSPRTGA